MFKLFLQRFVFSLILCAASLIIAVFNIVAFIIIFTFIYPIILLVEFMVSGKYQPKKWYYDLMFSYDLIIEFLWGKIVDNLLRILNDKDKQTFLS